MQDTKNYLVAAQNFFCFCKEEIYRLEEAMDKKIIGISILLVGLVTALFYFGGSELSRRSSASYIDVSATISTSNNSSSANWVSNAMTVKDLMSEADLIVRVRVSDAPVSRVVPIFPIDQRGNRIESAAFPVLFSDTVFEVLKTYVGTPLLTVTVMQTGGYDSTVSNGVEEMADDPLYKIGEEYILFLVNISGDPIHAPDRELYIIVNPFGRYRIDAGGVFMYGRNLSREVQLPATVIDLEVQIEQAKQELNK